MKFWNEMNKISTIITIATPIVTFILGIKFNNIKKWWYYKKIKKNASKNSGVLIISIGRNDIENIVKAWLNEKKQYEGISNDRIVIVEKIKEEIDVKDISTIMNDLFKKKMELQKKGVNKIHLFISAPVSISAMIGAELANVGNVIVYQHNSNKSEKYTSWGTLK